MNIILTAKDLDVSLTDSGQVSDVLALSLKQWTQNELWENNIDYEYEAGNKYVIDNYDYETKVIDWLNNKPAELPEQFYKEWKKQAHKPNGLKAGAWLALKYAEDFDAEISNYKQEMQEKCKYQYYEVDKSDIAYELAQKCEEAVNDFQAQNHKEWLCGDYYNFAGILRMAEREYNAEGVSVDESKNTLTFTLTDEQQDDIVDRNYEYEEGGRKTAKKIKELLVNEINVKADNYIQKKREEKQKRNAEYQRVKAYKEQQKAEAEAERIKKLMLMKV